MIDRSTQTFLVRLDTLGKAAGISFVMFSLLPVAAVLCIATGWIAFAGCWVPVILLVVLSYGAIIGGIVAIIVGIGGKHGGAFLGGAGALLVGCLCKELFDEWRSPLVAAANTSLAACDDTATFLFSDLFVGRAVYVWSWSLLALALVAAAAVFAFIGLLRLEFPVKYHLRRIGYTCQSCHRQGVPFFRCPSCSLLISDLYPTTFGILQAKCGKCGAVLPTTDMQGRLSLNKVCSNPSCSTDLDDPLLGRRSEFHIAVVGATSSGKTNLMVAAIRQFESRFAPDNDLTVTFANSSDKSSYDQWVRRLETGNVLDKTRSLPMPRALNLSVTPAHDIGCRLYVYDSAGEDFTEEDRMAGHTFQGFTDGIVFVLDPFAEPEIRRELLNAGKKVEMNKTNPAPVSASEILARIVSRLELVCRVTAGGKLPIPVAVVVTKTDACGLQARMGQPVDVDGYYTSIAAAATTAESRSDTVRQFLSRTGLENILRILETRFARVSYFGASALGRCADPSDNSPFRPRGAAAPLVWLCHHTQAITGTATWKRLCANSWFALRRSLRGHEGPKAQVAGWTAVVCAASVAFCTVWQGIALLVNSG